MLGVRHHKSTAIDLWCGDPDEFVADDYIGSLESLHAFHMQHVALTIDTANSAEQFFSDLKVALEDSSRPRRITVILPTLDIYRTYQHAFFDAFPELGDE